MFFSKPRQAIHLEFNQAKAQTGLAVIYDEAPDESARLQITGGMRPLAISFDSSHVDEAHILYMETTEILYSRAKTGLRHAEAGAGLAKAGESAESIVAVLEMLIEKYR